MAWNEPGGGKDKDPWGSRNKQEGPPDLDELVKKMQDKFGGMFGGRKGGGEGRGEGRGGSSPFGIGMIVIIILVGWILSGIYIVDPAERGVILQFGKYQSTVGPGPHWILRPIQTVEKVNVDKVRESTHKAQMLTKDENLLQIELAVLPGQEC
jgi:membrane protease subunit HflK